MTPTQKPLSTNERIREALDRKPLTVDEIVNTIPDRARGTVVNGIAALMKQGLVRHDGGQYFPVNLEPEAEAPVNNVKQPKPKTPKHEVADEASDIRIVAADGKVLRENISSRKQARVQARRLSQTEDVFLVQDGKRVLYSKGGQA